MADETNVTPAVTPTPKVNCQKTDCTKVYKARGTMLAHMRKHHQDSTKIHSPLGSFSPSNTATVLLFDEADETEADKADKDDDEEADKDDDDEAGKADADAADKAEADMATQGNSDGAVNSPKVLTKATFICAVCDIHFESKEEVTKHMDEVHVTVLQQLKNRTSMIYMISLKN